jgi:hypothetical protein
MDRKRSTRAQTSLDSRSAALVAHRRCAAPLFKAEHSGALGEASRVAGNLTRGPDQQQEFDPVELGLNIGSGAGLGAVMKPHETAAQPKPGLDEQAANLARGVDAQLTRPALAPPAETPDFVVNPQGQAQTPEQAAAATQGGPGFEQQTAAPPVAPSPPAPAPLALEHQPDITVDSRGRAVVNKGDRTLGQPVVDEQQAPVRTPEDAAIIAQRQAPSGPLGEAAAALPTTAEVHQPAPAQNPARWRTPPKHSHNPRPPMDETNRWQTVAWNLAGSLVRLRLMFLMSRVRLAMRETCGNSTPHARREIDALNANAANPQL